MAVGLVERHERHCPRLGRRARQPGGEDGGLAESGGGRDKGERSLGASVHECGQPRAGHQGAAQPRRGELGGDEVAGHAGSPRAVAADARTLATRRPTGASIEARVRVRHACLAGPVGSAFVGQAGEGGQDHAPVVRVRDRHGTDALPVRVLGPRPVRWPSATWSGPWTPPAGTCCGRRPGHTCDLRTAREQRPRGTAPTRRHEPASRPDTPCPGTVFGPVTGDPTGLPRPRAGEPAPRRRGVVSRGRDTPTDCGAWPRPRPRAGPSTRRSTPSPARPGGPGLAAGRGPPRPGRGRIRRLLTRSQIRIRQSSRPGTRWCRPATARAW